MDAQLVSAMLAEEIPDDPLPGFEPLPLGTGYTVFFGPVYGKMIDGQLRLGMRVGKRHINPHHTCHGGAIASFADMQVYVSQQHVPALRTMTLPTINLNIDYISPAVLGDWLEGHTLPLRQTKTILFQQTLGKVGERIVFRANATHHISGRQAPPGSSIGHLFPTPDL